MGEKNNDGGQFFTPREVIRAMVRAIDPKLGETVYDPCCGTGGFLAQAYEYMRAQARREVTTADQLETLKHGHVLRPREGEPRSTRSPWPTWSCTASTEPHIWHGNALTGDGGLRRAVRGRAAAVRRDPHQPALRRQGGQGGADALRLPDQRHPGAVPAARHPTL